MFANSAGWGGANFYSPPPLLFPSQSCKEGGWVGVMETRKRRSRYTQATLGDGGGHYIQQTDLLFSQLRIHKARAFLFDRRCPNTNPPLDKCVANSRPFLMLRLLPPTSPDFFTRSWPSFYLQPPHRDISPFRSASAIKKPPPSPFHFYALIFSPDAF